MTHKKRRSLRNLFGTDPSIVNRFFNQLQWRKKNTRYISVVCRRTLDKRLASSYAAVNKHHDIELKKIDCYYIGTDGRLMISLVTDKDRLFAGRDEWLYNCKSKIERPNESDKNEEISDVIYTLTAEDYLLNHVFGHDQIHKPFIADLLTRMEQFATQCNAASKEVLGTNITGKFAFAWTTTYNPKLGPHIDSEPSLLLHVGGELPDGSKQSRGSGVLSPRNIAYPDDDKILNLNRVSYLRVGDFAICAGGAQARLTKKLWHTAPERVGGFHTNGVLDTGHAKEPKLPEGSTRRTLISFALQ